MNQTVRNKIGPVSKPNVPIKKDSNTPNSYSAKTNNSIFAKNRLNIKRKSDLEILESQHNKVRIIFKSISAQNQNNKASYVQYFYKEKGVSKAWQVFRTKKTDFD